MTEQKPMTHRVCGFIPNILQRKSTPEKTVKEIKLQDPTCKPRGLSLDDTKEQKHRQEAAPTWQFQEIVDLTAVPNRTNQQEIGALKLKHEFESHAEEAAHQDVLDQEDSQVDVRREKITFGETKDQLDLTEEAYVFLEGHGTDPLDL